jgi:hypothetical protein
MTPLQAKTILSNIEMDKDRLYSLGWYLCVYAGDKSAVLDGDFEPDDLEAIAMWMRDPVLVTNAKDDDVNV